MQSVTTGRMITGKDSKYRNGLRLLFGRAQAADLPLKASVTVELLMLLDDIQRKRAIECPTHDMCVNMLAQMVYVMQWCDGLRECVARVPPDA